VNTPARQSDEAHMAHALALARRAWGETSPNPLVGAVIVEDGRVVAEGWHDRDGGPHAERVALAALGRRPKPTATLYVTLEPCSTHGRTGACCDAIRAAGITRVVVAAEDPNPAHAGRGLEVLRAAGVAVTAGVRAEEATELNLIFNHWITRQRPLFAAKIATTQDGYSAPPAGAPHAITGEAARADVHHWRRLFPAIAVGAGTVLTDNPALTRRWRDEATGEARETCGVRFIFDPSLRTAAARPEAWPRVYTDQWRAQTVVVATAGRAEPNAARALAAAGIVVWVLLNARGAAFWTEFAARCAAARISGVYLEGGATVLGDAAAAGALDYVFWYRTEHDAPSGTGWSGRVEWADARWRDRHETRLGVDTLTRGWWR
jgi:diaminohydroxyphosphoribosylaminopyrimidine deaminase / 5-amino-6-(5-phosphoribosylamino)uracil reductase